MEIVPTDRARLTGPLPIADDPDECLKKAPTATTIEPPDEPA